MTTGGACSSPSCQSRFGDPACLAVWRVAGARPWDNEDRLLLAAAANLIRFVLEHEAIQREMARQARTDPLTGLLNRRAFLEEIARCAERLDREEMPGTLMFVDLDNFKVVNDAMGHDMGDQVLVHTATLLRNVVRPTDLVARLGGDEFAVWMNGADHMTAAERAEQLRTQVPREMSELARRQRAAARRIDRHRHAAARQPGADRQRAAPRRPGHVRGQAPGPRPLARGAGGIHVTRSAPRPAAPSLDSPSLDPPSLDPPSLGLAALDRSSSSPPVLAPPALCPPAPASTSPGCSRRRPMWRPAACHRPACHPPACHQTRRDGSARAPTIAPIRSCCSRWRPTGR